MTLRTTSWHCGLGIDAQQIAFYGAFREGQNSIVALIIGAMKKGMESVDKPSDQLKEG